MHVFFRGVLRGIGAGRGERRARAPAHCPCHNNVHAGRPGWVVDVPSALLGWPRASFYTLQESTTR
jgi:hypothetical protein